MAGHTVRLAESNRPSTATVAVRSDALQGTTHRGEERQ
jgi:hypothetical protein